MLEGLQGIFVEGGLEHDEGFWLGEMLRDIESVDFGHSDIEQDHVRFPFSNQLQGFEAVRGLTYQLNVEFRQHDRQPSARSGFVIDHENAHRQSRSLPFTGKRTVTVAPSPAVPTRSSESSPYRVSRRSRRLRRPVPSRK